LRAFWSPPALFFSPASGLSTRVCGAFSDDRPRHFSVAVHPPVPCTSPSEHLLLRPALPETPLRPCDRLDAPARAPSLRFPSPSSRRQPTVSTWIRDREPPRPLRSVRGVSHALDGLFHHRPCGLVSSRCHVQGSPFRELSPTAKPTRLSPDLRALVPLVLRGLRCDPAQPHRPPTSGPCSLHDGCGGSPATVKKPVTPRPSWVFSSTGISSPTPRRPEGSCDASGTRAHGPCDPPCRHPSFTFTAMNPPQLVFDDLTLPEPAGLESGCRPARGFPT